MRNSPNKLNTSISLPLESDQILAWFRLLYLRLVEEFLESFLRNREVLYYLLVTELIHALYSPVEFSTETKVY